MSTLRLLAVVFLLASCSSHVVRGEFVGSTYVNNTAGYAFSIPAGWRHDDHYRAQLEQQTGRPSSVEFALRGEGDSLILGAASRSWSEVSLASPGPIAGPDKALFLRKWFSEQPTSEYDQLSVAVREFGPNTFVLVTGPEVCSPLERARAATTNRPWSRFALTQSRGYTYLFFGNICDPDARGSFEELLAGVRLLK
jgi:hypothetical protein